MGILMGNLALCMFVAIMPTVLLCSTAEYMRRHTLFVDRLPLILLNVLFDLSVIAIVQDRQVSTVTAWSSVGFMAAATVLVLIVFSVLLRRIWRKLQARTQRLVANLREEQPTLSQSFLST